MRTPTSKVAAGDGKRAVKREVLNLSKYATYFFTVLANKLSSGASRLYLKRFGIGIIEWRVMAMLAIEPRIAPARISQVVGLDKASVSRESRKLEEKGYLISSGDGANQTRKLLQLTAKGYSFMMKSSRSPWKGSAGSCPTSPEKKLKYSWICLPERPRRSHTSTNTTRLLLQPSRPPKAAKHDNRIFRPR
jgi:DNA-binding MarR family transcriptional regulator